MQQMANELERCVGAPPCALSPRVLFARCLSAEPADDSACDTALARGSENCTATATAADAVCLLKNAVSSDACDAVTPRQPALSALGNCGQRDNVHADSQLARALTQTNSTTRCLAGCPARFAHTDAARQQAPYALLASTAPLSSLRDDTQSLAAAAFLPQVDALVDRDSLAVTPHPLHAAPDSVNPEQVLLLGNLDWEESAVAASLRGGDVRGTADAHNITAFFQRLAGGPTAFLALWPAVQRYGMDPVTAAVLTVTLRHAYSPVPDEERYASMC
jgi:hypothetical protein